MIKSNNTQGNPNHDENGRFTSSDGASSGSNKTEQKIKEMGFAPKNKAKIGGEDDVDLEKEWESMQKAALYDLDISDGEKEYLSSTFKGRDLDRIIHDIHDNGSFTEALNNHNVRAEKNKRDHEEAEEWDEQNRLKKGFTPEQPKQNDTISKIKDMGFEPKSKEEQFTSKESNNSEWDDDEDDEEEIPSLKEAVKTRPSALDSIIVPLMEQEPEKYDFDIEEANFDLDGLLTKQNNLRNKVKEILTSKEGFTEEEADNAILNWLGSEEENRKVYEPFFARMTGKI
jgi:hypothetical protein